MERKIKVSGVGCCLVDRIYDHIDFGSEAFRRVTSRTSGDGGLEPGKLEFEEEVERFSGQRFAELLPTLTDGRQPDKENIGGPCIVALIHAAQLLGETAQVDFYGCRGDDEVGSHLAAALSRTPVNLAHYRIEPGKETASTVVLSDHRGTISRQTSTSRSTRPTYASLAVRPSFHASMRDWTLCYAMPRTTAHSP